MTSKEAFTKIMKIYGDTNSLEGTYELFLKIKHDLERLETLEQENKELKICNKEIEELYLNENKHWCETIDSLRKENEKLKMAIEILKDHVQFKLVPIVSNDPILEGVYHFGIKIDKYGYYAILPKIEAEVLKEVLGE